MSELRHDELTGAWAILAESRSGRPRPNSRRERPEVPSHDPSCPFCRGNEGKTPTEIARYSLTGRQGWQVRIVPNFFPILTTAQAITTKTPPQSPATGAAGLHEVVVETPRHDARPASMAPDELQLVIIAWRERLLEISRELNLRYVVIFKNFGETAGASLTHPHSQIVASDFVPPRFKGAVARARHLHRSGAGSSFERLADQESPGPRLILATDHFVSFLPFAPVLPFEVRLLPRRQRSSIADVPDVELADLTVHLLRLFQALQNGMNDPDFNLIVHTMPFRKRNTRYLSWYIQLIPRLATMGGFEIASGVLVLSLSPEETAQVMRANLRD